MEASPEVTQFRHLIKMSPITFEFGAKINRSLWTNLVSIVPTIVTTLIDLSSSKYDKDKYYKK